MFEFIDLLSFKVISYLLAVSIIIARSSNLALISSSLDSSSRGVPST